MSTPSTVQDSWGRNTLRRIDALLRQSAAGGGEADPATDPAAASSARELLRIGAVCAALYGLAMGFYAASMRGWPGAAQMVAAALKVPLLFLVTIAVTFPSFHVLCVVRGSTASGAQLLRVQLVGAVIATALLASLAPITLFFTLSTESHGFMVLLNTGFFAVAGALGLRVVWSRGRVLLHDETTAERPSTASPAIGLLRAWLVIAIAVGAQSAWILRPLVGRPGDAFTLFEARESNALLGFLASIRDMLA